MSILIKGMEMPKDIEPGLVIEFADGIDGKRYARLYHYRHGGLTEWLEAVSVPPHGRLIDADAAIADLKRQCREVFRIDAVSPNDFWINRNEAYNQRLWQTWCEGFYDYLGSRQTIIEAEEGE